MNCKICGRAACLTFAEIASRTCVACRKALTEESRRMAERKPLPQLRPVVYVSGPITKGDQFQNMRRAIDASNALMDAGMVPICPHLSAIHHVVYERPWQDWMEQDYALIARCDLLVRIPGESVGGDLEVAFAIERGIPVYYSVEDAIEGRSSQ